MTWFNGAVNVHSHDGKKRRHSQSGTALAINQKTPLKAATMAIPRI